MNKLKCALLLFTIFIISAGCAFYFEALYRKFIRYLYVAFTNNRISFFIPAKEFRFVSATFVLAFCLFALLLSFFLYCQASNTRGISLGWAVILFILSTLIQAYFFSLSELATCTACQEGTKKMRYNDIGYDPIFIMSLIAAILPALISIVKEYSKKRSLEGRSY